MAKPKLSLEVSDKDKRLLLMLFSVIIIVVAYVFGYQKFSDKTDEYKKELRTLKTKVADLEEKEDNLEQYEEDIVKYKEESADIMMKYGSAVTQPSTIEFLNKIERITDTWVKSVSFSGTTQVYSFGNIQSSNPNYQGEKAYSTDLAGYKTSVTLSYEAEYEQWKELIEYINTYDSKNVIESISMSYSNISDKVTGTMTLALYNIIGGNIPVTEPVFDIDTGTDNIFFSDETYTSDTSDSGEYILNDYDYYMLINPATSTLDSCVIGAKADITNEAMLSANSEDTQKVNIKITGEEGNYKAEYSIDGKKNSTDIPVGDTLDLLIMSSARLSYDDLSGIELTVENDTDITLNIKVFNDDTQNPRVYIKSTEGDVKVY